MRYLLDFHRVVGNQSVASYQFNCSLAFPIPLAQQKYTSPYTSTITPPGYSRRQMVVEHDMSSAVKSEVSRVVVSSGTWYF